MRTPKRASGSVWGGEVLSKRLWGREVLRLFSRTQLATGQESKPKCRAGSTPLWSKFWVNWVRIFSNRS